MKKIFYFLVPTFLFILIFLFILLFYRRLPSSAWKIEEIVDIFPKGINLYVVFDNLEEIFKTLNRNGLIDSMKKREIFDDLLFYLGVSKKIRDEINKADLTKLFKRIGIGFFDEGYLVILEPQSFFINLIFNLMKFSKEYNKVPYTFLWKDIVLFFIEKYIVISNNEDLLKQTIDHLKGKKLRYKRFYKKNFPKNSIVYGAYVKDGLFFKSEKFIFYYTEIEGLTLLIEKPSCLLGNILMKIEPDLKNTELPPDYIVYLSFKNLRLKDEIERFIKEMKNESIAKFFEKKLYFFKNLGNHLTFSFKGFNYFSDYYSPLFLIKLGKENETEKSFSFLILDISKGGLTKKEGKLGNIDYRFFVNRNAEEFIGYFIHRDDFYLSSSSEILKEQISVINGQLTKKGFPNIENLFLYFDGVIFIRFLENYLKNIIKDELVLEKKIFPILNLIEIKEIYGTLKKEKDRIIIKIK
ncbi:MAG: hypothetical protein ABDH37_01075 [Candidatus Hydrothermales bacterium]